MTKSQTNMRLDDATRDKLAKLATRWSPIKPLTLTDVVRECVRRVHETETSKTKEKRR
jgi:predicted transcriptional regulator